MGRGKGSGPRGTVAGVQNLKVVKLGEVEGDK